MSTLIDKVCTKIYQSQAFLLRLVVTLRIIDQYRTAQSQEVYIKLTIKAEITVEKHAPINPSQVFFGESFIKGVFPKKMPKK
jgi:hypothetical protein